jgi:two-component system sensor histidine kinase and response regulator WspE
LVVDDSPTVRATESRLLEQHQYQVHQAANGVEAWEALLHHTYQLVITDVDMPGMNGLELVRQIRNHPRFQTLPVIMVSYRDRAEDRQMGLEAGANFYLTKSSFQDDTLVQAVEELLKHTSALASLP